MQTISSNDCHCSSYVQDPAYCIKSKGALSSAEERPFCEAYGRHSAKNGYQCQQDAEGLVMGKDDIINGCFMDGILQEGLNNVKLNQTEVRGILRHTTQISLNLQAALVFSIIFNAGQLRQNQLFVMHQIVLLKMYSLNTETYNLHHLSGQIDYLSEHLGSIDQNIALHVNFQRGQFRSTQIA